MRCGLFCLLNEKRLLSFSQKPTALLTSIRAGPHHTGAEVRPFAERTTTAFFRAALRQNEQLVGVFTQDLHALEEVPVRDSRAEFFERTFRLKKELSVAQADLWRLKSLLVEIAELRAALPGMRAEAAPEFQRLADDAAFGRALLALYEATGRAVWFDAARSVADAAALLSVLLAASAWRSVSIVGSEFPETTSGAM